MNTKHTPGPWKFKQWADGSTSVYVGPVSLAPIKIRGAPEQRLSAADGALLAAAPDLLAALRSLVRSADMEHNSEPDSIYVEIARSEFDRARAAIAKALGEVSP